MDFPPVGLMIVGAHKAGTTSLKEYLAAHPQVITHPQIEFGYFMHDGEWVGGYEAAVRKYFHSTSSIGSEHVVLAKTASMADSEQGIERLVEHNPNCHLVYLMRHPAEKVHSAYYFEAMHGNVSAANFDEVIRDILEKQDENDLAFQVLIEHTRYEQVIERLWQRFPREQVHIILFDDLKQDPDSMVQQLIAAVGLDAVEEMTCDRVHNPTTTIRSPTFARFVQRLLDEHNPVKKAARAMIPVHSAYRVSAWLKQINQKPGRFPPLKPETRAALEAYFEPMVKRLESMLDRDLCQWRTTQPETLEPMDLS